MRPIPVAFHIGPLLVHTYGIGLAIAFWFAYRYFERRLRAQGYPTRWVFRLFIWVIVSAIVGARAAHVLANLSYYRGDPGQVMAIWHGGLSSWGGLILAVPVGIVVTRRSCPQLRLGAALDLVAPVLAAAWAVGRILGPQLMVAGGGHPTHQWFGMYYADQVGKRLPVPVFQAAEDFAIFCVLIYVERRVRAATAAASARAGWRGGGDAASGAGADIGTAAITDGGAWPHPAGTVIGTGMVLWGIERVLDEKLWLAYPGQLGDVLVEAAGLALAIAGVAVLVVTRHRWSRWEPAAAPALEPEPPAGEATGYAAADASRPTAAAVDGAGVARATRTPGPR